MILEHVRAFAEDVVFIKKVKKKETNKKRNQKKKHCMFLQNKDIFFRKVVWEKRRFSLD